MHPPDGVPVHYWSVHKARASSDSAAASPSIDTAFEIFSILELPIPPSDEVCL